MIGRPGVDWFCANYATSQAYYHDYLRYPASMDKARIGYILKFIEKVSIKKTQKRYRSMQCWRQGIHKA